MKNSTFRTVPVVEFRTVPFVDLVPFVEFYLTLLIKEFNDSPLDILTRGNS